MNSSSKKLLITGSNGFIGQNLLAKIDYSKFDIISISKTTKVKGIKNIITDLTQTNYAFLKELNPDFVIYLGTTSSPKMAASDPNACFNSNVITIQKFLEAAKDLKIKKIIFFSSAVLYKDQEKEKYQETDSLNPFQDIYNFSKFTLENLAQYYREQFNLPITVFRLSNTYGPYQNWDNFPSLIPQLFKQALTERKIEVWNTTPIRDWVYVDDIISTLIKELGIIESGLYNLGTGVGSSVKEVVKIISHLTGVKISDLNKSVHPPFKVILNESQLKKHLNYVPDTSLESGLLQTYNFYQNLNQKIAKV